MGRVQGVEVEVGQAVENLQKQLVEVRGVAYTPLKLMHASYPLPWVPPCQLTMQQEEVLLNEVALSPRIPHMR